MYGSPPFAASRVQAARSGFANPLRYPMHPFVYPVQSVVRKGMQLRRHAYGEMSPEALTALVEGGVALTKIGVDVASDAAAKRKDKKKKSKKKKKSAAGTTPSGFQPSTAVSAAAPTIPTWAYAVGGVVLLGAVFALARRPRTPAPPFEGGRR